MLSAGDSQGWNEARGTRGARRYPGVVRDAPAAPAALLSSTPMRIMTVLAIVGLCVSFALREGRDERFDRFADPKLFVNTVEAMRDDGLGYYEAMDRELRARIGPAETPRAFRMPTIFLFWRLLPGEDALWLGFVALAGAVAVVLMGVSAVPVLGIVIAAYLLNLGFNAFTIVEFWALLPIAIAIASWRGEQWWLAAGMALLAVLIRETTLLLLLGGLLAAHVQRRPRAPWLVALGLAVAALIAHVVATQPYLVGQGTEAPLLFTGDIVIMLKTMGVGLPAPVVLGPIVWLAGVAAVWRDERLRFFLGPHLLLPLVGLLVFRIFWGILVTPFALLFALDLLVVTASHRRGVLSET